jgi:hypothetical protein
MIVIQYLHEDGEATVVVTETYQSLVNKGRETYHPQGPIEQSRYSPEVLTADTEVSFNYYIFFQPWMILTVSPMPSCPYSSILPFISALSSLISIRFNVIITN